MDIPAGTLRLPARVHFGYGSRAQLGEVLGLGGRRVLAVVDPFLIETPIFGETVAGLTAAGFDVAVYSDIRPELPTESLDDAAAFAREHEPDVILAAGGGSALDAAKLVGLLVTHGGPLSRYYGENLVPGPVLPLVAVPTTAGTGSEVTPVAVVSDPERETKVGISSPYLIPVAAIVDPEFTLGAPRSVTAFAGIDALVHAVESFTAARLEQSWDGGLPVFTGRNAFTDAMALRAVERLGPSLPVAVGEPGDRRAREEVAFGSLLAGVCFGATGTHLSHALQYPIGAFTKTPHGLGTGLLLPYVLQACLSEPEVVERIAAVGAALGSTAATDDGRAGDAISSIVALNRVIGVPASLQEIGITREQLPQLAELASRSTRLIAIAPIPAPSATLLDILEHAYTGDLTERSDP
ncbi:iron-containing alcohol dehydrogenase [Microbispora sp. NBRC 16548]|uniref:iron-containing alcohol dehydrogenase n=1 Tax=Microbispora sp. NBRC 16548 TaxID=3030994 RepID=UPI0024A4DEB6|nr:iron-containing alcohol dehydrogenase [Microbispora sp. NBRC 16548]GLX03903.1 alcohol dehydrogenase [Microbispora sp. NBRC 16548]